MITIDEIIRLANKNNISAYNISKNTKVSERAIGMVLNKEVKRPHSTTLTEIYDYLISIDNDTEILSKEYPIDIESKKINEPTGYYYPDVMASAGMDTEINNHDLKRIPVNIPGWENDLLFINVYSDSMYPRYNSGEIIGVKSIEFQYLNYGYPYVVVFKNGDTYIKIIQEGSDSEHLLLESTNEFYKPKQFHLSLIKSFYSIKGVVKKEMM